MAEEIKQWEYRVQTIGSVFGTKDENIEATLDAWGLEGWETINVYTPYGSGKITIVAKRPLTERAPDEIIATDMSRFQGEAE